MHVVGKGVLRFHAVYWPAILLSAGEPLPTEIFVHDYLTVDGRKISKSAAARPRTRAANSNDPVALASAYGADALRWWLLREVPRVGDTDFTVDKLIARANEDLANGLGNLVNRVVSARAFIPERGRPALRPARGHEPLARGSCPTGTGCADHGGPRCAGPWRAPTGRPALRRGTIERTPGGGAHGAGQV